MVHSTGICRFRLVYFCIQNFCLQFSTRFLHCVKCMFIIKHHCVLGTPNRDADFSNKASNFVEHGQKLADTASLVANFGAPTADKQLLDQINATGQEV